MRLNAGFWLAFITETLTTRHVSRLAAVRMGREISHFNGLEYLPAKGSFVLAVNHYKARHSLDVTAAVMNAISQRRPDAVNQMLFIVGQRTNKPIPAPVARVLQAFYHRWERNVLRISLQNSAPVVTGLRDWKRRSQPMFVFPEGRVSDVFDTIRPGAGRWLGQLEHPVIPVGVWWDAEGWHVSMGAPVMWSVRPELHDTQLGLHMATLLPPALAPDWADLLDRWRTISQ